MTRRKQSHRRIAASLLLSVALSELENTKAKESPTSVVHRVLDCGLLSVTSDAKLAASNDDLDAQGLSQITRLTDMSMHRSVTLPIFQHWSRDKDLQGRKILDGLVWAFECVILPSGKTYVMLH